MSAPKIVMYVMDWCPYCTRARNLLAAKGVAVEEIDVEAVPGALEQMRARSGQDTVPQIFIGESHVGGSDDLQALDADGRLDVLLKQPERP
jgi:glutaredoxin 3